MKELKQENLENITGGFSAWVALGIVSLVIFISGVIEGIVHPRSCND